MDTGKGGLETSLQPLPPIWEAAGSDRIRFCFLGGVFSALLVKAERSDGRLTGSVTATLLTAQLLGVGRL